MPVNLLNRPLWRGLIVRSCGGGDNVSLSSDHFGSLDRSSGLYCHELKISIVFRSAGNVRPS
jgi:hypothetical protein